MSSPTIIVYVDDAAYAQPLLAALAARADAVSSRWLLVACAPRITYRASKWASYRARENWRQQWADKLFAQLSACLQEVQAPAQLTLLLARQPLPDLLAELQQSHGPAQVIDARRPKQETSQPRWGLFAAMGSLFALMLEESLV